MNAFGVDAIKAFLDEKNKPSSSSKGRLIIQKNEIYFRNKSSISFIVRFQAKLGFGNVSLQKIASKINRQREALFASKPEEMKINSQIRDEFNSFIVSYNKNRTLCWKKAKCIKELSINSVSKLDFAAPLTNEHMFKIIENHFKKCKQAFSTLNKNHPNELIDAFDTLSLALEGWEPTLKQDNKKKYRMEKKLLNEILNLKNEVRSACMPARDKPLKGSQTFANKLLDTSHQQKLNEVLKSVRRKILKKHFNERLDNDAKKLAELQMRFIENKEKNIFKNQEVFLESQLEKWQKKIDNGKPISIPKWYHCTKNHSMLQKILDTFILYMHKGAFPGCFVANLPEHRYGNFCIAMSEYIEITGTKNPKSKNPVYPHYSQLLEGQDYPIFYSDTPKAPQNSGYKNNQQGVGIWFGFQRGAKTLNRATGFGREGIPLKCLNRLNTRKPLSYYKDTTVSFIFGCFKDDTINIQSIGKKRRIQVLSFDEQEALRSLINATFICTLPKSWENKLKQCSGRF